MPWRSNVDTFENKLTPKNYMGGPTEGGTYIWLIINRREFDLITHSIFGLTEGGTFDSEEVIKINNLKHYLENKK